MADAQNPDDWLSRTQPPHAPMQFTPGVGQFETTKQPLPNNVQLKTGQSVLNGPVSGTQGQPMFQPPSSRNGISSSQGDLQMNGQVLSPRPVGPSVGQNIQGGQFNQPYRPNVPPGGGPFRPSGPLQNIQPPFSGPPSASQGAFRPPARSGPPRMPPSSVAGMPFVSAASSQAAGIPGQPLDTSTPLKGMTPRMPFSQLQQPPSSGPSSQKSSRTNSPAVSNQNLDALEGQFRGTPDQDTQVTALLGTSQPGTPFRSVQQPNTSMPQQIGILPGTSQTGIHAGMPPVPHTSMAPGIRPQGSFPQQPGMPPRQPGMPPQQPGMPPRQPGMPPQQPGMPPRQPGMPPQQPGILPLQPGLPPQQPGMFPASQRFPPPPSGGQQPSTSMAPRPGLTPQPPGQGSSSMPSFNSQQPGFPPAVVSSNQLPGFPTSSVSTNQQPGFPTSSVSSSQQPGFPPSSMSFNQQPGFPSAAVSANQQPGFPPPPISTNQQPGFPPPAGSTSQQPGFPPQPTGLRPGFPPAPLSTANQQPGFPPPPLSTANQQPGFPPPPTSTNQYTGFNQAPMINQMPGFPPAPGSQPGGAANFNQPPSQSKYAPQGKTIGEFVNQRPDMNAMTTGFNNMSVQGFQNINLLQQKSLIPPDGMSIPKPVIPNDSRNVNCNPEVFRCTLNNIPQTSALLNKSRLPLGILIHPFKDLSQLPVIQSSVIVRCRSCRTYINPFVYFVDARRWKCNLCYRVNELPDEFSFDPVTKSYGDPQRRPEIKSATIEFIAPSEYMLRPPQPAVYLYLIDVSFNAIETGYLSIFCETLLDVLDRIPGDARTQVGFIAYDSSVHFFNLAEGLSQPQMLTVTDVDDIFLPCPDDLLVNLHECKGLVTDLLSQLPVLFENNMETRSALGAALQASLKMVSATGGRISVMQTVLPTYGPGALQNREDSTQKTSKDISSLGPATDFYKKMALDCSAQQVAVDLFMFNGQYADLASLECISKFSGGCVYYYPSYHAVRTPHLAEKYEADFRRYLTRKVGFESVMRIRCSKGISIHTFHGNFFVRSTDLLSLPNVNPDAGFGMQMSIEESLTEMSTMCFQAALLYTSSKGERRIRVHTLCLPVTNQISEIHAGADQQAIIALLAKMAVDRSISSSMSDAREAIVNAAIDILSAYSSTLPASQKIGGLLTTDTLKLIPLYCLALLKSTAFRTGISTRLDDRTFALHQCKTLPATDLLKMLYPDLYPVHTIMEVDMVKKGSLEYPNLPLLQLSSANIDRNGAYLLDTGDTLYLYLGSSVNPKFCQDVLDRPHFSAVQEGGIAEFPELENEGSERFRAFITYLLDVRPNGGAFVIVREDGKLRMKFFQHFVEDRTESSISYVEFLQQIQVQVKS